MTPRLTDRDREMCHLYTERGGYYVTLDPTGTEAIDLLIGALHVACRGAHHTRDWTDPTDWVDADSLRGLLQLAAHEAAAIYTQALQVAHELGVKAGRLEVCVAEQIDGAECSPECDSGAHVNNCPVADPLAYAREQGRAEGYLRGADEGRERGRREGLEQAEKIARMVQADELRWYGPERAMGAAAVLARIGIAQGQLAGKPADGEGAEP